MPKKVCEKFAGYEKVTTFATALDERPARDSPERGSEKTFKKLPKDLVVKEKGYTFAPLSALKKSGKATRVARSEEATRNSSYSDIGTAFFEVLEQLKVFPLSHERVISNNTFEIRAKDLTKLFLYNGEFDPGSG